MADNSKALEVLRATIDRPPGSVPTSASGARLINLIQTSGFWSLAMKRPLTAEEAIRISAVLICLDVLAQDIAKTTFRMYEPLPGGGKREIEPGEHHVADLLRTAPNPYHTWYEFFEMTMLHLGFLQNAFTAKRLSRSGQIEELIPVMPARTSILAVSPENDVSGRGFFAYDVQRFETQEKIMLSGLPDVFLPHEFIHFRGRMIDGLMGYSNLQAAAKTFRLSDELIDYQTRLYANDGQLRGVFQHGAESGDSLSDEAFERLRDQLAEAMHNFRQLNRPIVLEEGMTFQHIAMNADQAEVAKARDAAIVDVARTFRTPPHKVMHLVNVKYENMETLEKSYVQDTLIPYCIRIEERMKIALLSPQDRAKYFFQFDRQEMLLNDIQKITEAVKMQMEHGGLLVDEMRHAFGRNPLPNGAGRARIVPSTYNLVDENNQIVIAAGAQPASGGADGAATGDSGTTKPKKEVDPASLDNVIPLRSGEE